MPLGVAVSHDPSGDDACHKNGKKTSHLESLGSSSLNRRAGESASSTNP
jgi:hypothetical protein